MKEVELIKRLENTEIPEIEVRSHRRALKMALLNAGYLQGERQATVLTRVKTKSAGGTDSMLKGLISRRAAWKAVLLSTLAVAIIVTAAIVLPGLMGNNPKAMAASIAQNSPEIRKYAGEGRLKTDVTSLSDGKGTVVVEGDKGAVTAEVDIKSKTVTLISATPDFTLNKTVAIGLVDNDNTDIQRCSYQISIQYRGKDSVKLESIGPVLTDAFSRLVVSSKMDPVANATLNTWDTIEVSGEIIFNAKGLSKFDIVKLDPFVSGLRINSERVLTFE